MRGTSSPREGGAIAAFSAGRSMWCVCVCARAWCVLANSKCNAKTVSIKQLAPLKQIQHVLWLINWSIVSTLVTPKRIAFSIPSHSPSHCLVTLISPGLAAAAAAVVANCGSIFLLFRLGFYSFSIFSRISRLITNNICMVIFNWLYIVVYDIYLVYIKLLKSVAKAVKFIW